MKSMRDRPRAGVAGWPIAHSRSPLIHRFWLNRLGIPGDYERFAVPPGEFAVFAEKIGRKGLVGSNVTVPHKEAAFLACNRRTPVAQALGAVNVLWREDGLLWGDNTDVNGFLANMDESAPGWAESSRSAVVIGAGGAARAILQALSSRELERITVVNRTYARARALVDQYDERVVASPWDTLSSNMAETDLLINASSLGMVGQLPLNVDVGVLSRDAIVADIVYVPLRTPLIEAAQARGLRTVEGLGMLLHQAAPAFERWFGIKPDVTPDLRALVEADIVASQEGAP
jgi:shikimate dehydrogenase